MVIVPPPSFCLIRLRRIFSIIFWPAFVACGSAVIRRLCRSSNSWFIFFSALAFFAAEAWRCNSCATRPGNGSMPLARIESAALSTSSLPCSFESLSTSIWSSGYHVTTPSTTRRFFCVIAAASEIGSRRCDAAASFSASFSIEGSPGISPDSRPEIRSSRESDVSELPGFLISGVAKAV